MTTCEFWTKTHSSFNQVLSTTNLSEKYGRNCKKHGYNHLKTEQYELALEIMDNELKLSGELLKSYELQCRFDFIRLDKEVQGDGFNNNTNCNNGYNDELCGDSIFINVNVNNMKKLNDDAMSLCRNVVLFCLLILADQSGVADVRIYGQLLKILNILLSYIVQNINQKKRK